MRNLWIVALLTAFSTANSQDIPLPSGVGINVRGVGRTPVRLDSFESKFIQGWTAPPKAGDPFNNTKWEAVQANEKGEYTGNALRGGYVWVQYNSPKDQILVLRASGHNMVYVNGTPHMGDPYGYGYVGVPVQLKKGPNSFVFSTGRGGLSARLATPKSNVEIDLADTTLPDLTAGRVSDYGGIVIRNNSNQKTRVNLSLVTQPGKPVSETAIELGPLSYRKVPVLFAGGGTEFRLLAMVGDKTESEVPIKLGAPAAGSSYKRTFLSTIDDSVQYYAVNPSFNSGSNQALFLSLHGASVEAIGQAQAYSAKSWGNVVCPTNRRPFGFDWEDIGRQDAMEVLGLASTELRADPERIYLTGHSMGGHGTWQVGVQYPDQFAAIAPSAGWVSFFSYGGGVPFPGDDPFNTLLRRATNPSNTLLLKQNYAEEGVFILHGDADDNVPVTEARTMREELSKFHKDFQWLEMPGQGHWYDTDPEPGANCVDNAAIFDFFAKHRRRNSAEVREINFTTASPSVSASNFWATILQQDHCFEISNVTLRLDPFLAKFTGTTTNVATLKLDLVGIPKSETIKLNLDGQDLTFPRPTSALVLHKAEGKWDLGTPEGELQKSPQRYGGFKQVFANHVALVYGTHGNPAENQWAYNKAIFDAEQFYYRGNSGIRVIPDTDFGILPPNANAILYGNTVSNSAYERALAPTAPRLQRGLFTFGKESISKPGVAIYTVYPRKGSPTGMIGIVGGTDITGMRLTERAPLFVSGASFPDLFAFTADMLDKGIEGVIATGYYSNDWGVGSDIAIRK